ncbi:plasmid mobilization protein [Leisingera caerulea]|uniref:Plasmid mobilization relaxosome protein MobC n=1 Tax=Leisingera caerulea TaxID=506591 RepID=A0A9Q9HIK3_LEICA|nr:plasmid mobilization relaxosome protein MobC [Leisingera caerulea]UWQ55001.1 plasmid mobilization relaxosome protein MobC [Leisingera caerulea]
MEVRLNDRERTEIERRARAGGVTLSRLVRHAALSVKLPARRANIDAEAVAALNRIGCNLNQIARAGNISKSLSAADLRKLSILRSAIADAVNAIQGAEK